MWPELVRSEARVLSAQTRDATEGERRLLQLAQPWLTKLVIDRHIATGDLSAATGLSVISATYTKIGRLVFVHANFTITVTNTGDVALTNVTVTDPLVPDCDNAIGALAISATVSYGCEDVGVVASYTNVATVTSQLDTGGPGPTATASADVNSVPPTSVSLSGFGGDAVAFSPVWLVALLAVVVGIGFVVRRKLTA